MDIRHRQKPYYRGKVAGKSDGDYAVESRQKPQGKAKEKSIGIE